MNSKIVCFQVILFLCLFIGIDQTVSAQVLQQDSLALVALYDSTDGANWTDNTNWLAGPVSTWFGITGVSLGRVTQVQLIQNNLVGTIPPDVGDLTNLTRLLLDGNILTGSIPTEIGNLTNLTDLDLENNQLSGPIPTEIGNLNNLQFLRLKFNQLTGTIPSEIGNLTNLKLLVLRGNQLTGSIPTEIGNLANLTNLDLAINQLTGSIPTGIGNLTNLLTLRLYQNQLSGPISSEIGNLMNLIDLDLDRNQLTGSIPTEIFNLTNLTELDLSFNQLTGPIPTQIGNLTNLTRLQLSANQLTGAIPTEIGNLTNLTLLRLEFTQLTGPIPTEFGNLTNLRTLYLFNNQLSDAVPASIVNLSNLQTLYVYNNQLTDLPDLSSITSLTDLQIQFNKFTFEDIEPNIGVATFTYSPQDSVGTRMDTTVTQGTGLTVSVSVGGTANQYQWMKNGTDIAGAVSSSYTINSVDSSDVGSYECRITNTIATLLTLYSRPINVSLSGITGIPDHSTQIPRAFALHQNYPNPFNPSTTIEFSLPRSGYVTLLVYSTLGEEVATLVSENLSAGRYTAEWDASAFSSGVYFYRLQAGEFVETKKLILLR